MTEHEIKYMFVVIQNSMAIETDFSLSKLSTNGLIMLSNRLE